MFRVKVSEQSAEKIIEMDRWMSAILISWIRNNLYRCVNPRKYGKSLFKKDNRFWQYRLGEHRLLAIINDDSRLLVLTDIHSGETNVVSTK